MQLSEFDYLPEPLEPAKLRVQIDRALSHRRVSKTDEAVKEELVPLPLSEPASTSSEVLVGKVAT